MWRNFNINLVDQFQACVLYTGSQLVRYLCENHSHLRIANSFTRSLCAHFFALFVFSFLLYEVIWYLLSGRCAGTIIFTVSMVLGWAVQFRFEYVRIAKESVAPVVLLCCDVVMCSCKVFLAQTRANMRTNEYIHIEIRQMMAERGN